VQARSLAFASSDHPSAQVLTLFAGGKAIYPIDLETALRLADATNPQLHLVRERIQQALAQQQQARALWLPAVRGGVTYSQHTGPLQDTVGKIINTNRNSLEAGSGAFAFGSGPPMLPGVAFDFQVADALFQPLAARRAVEAKQAASAAASNDLLFEVGRHFVELQRNYADVGIAQECLDNTEQLAQITDAFAKSGTGLLSDADRVRAELEIRRNESLRSQESVVVSSARLARPLRLDQNLLLHPLDHQLVPLELVSLDTPLVELITQAGSHRPEMAEVGSLIGEAQARRTRERMAPFVPTVSIGTSYGGFGGSGGGNPYAFSDRTDFQAIAYWQLRNLGLGDQAALRDRQSQVRQMNLRRETLIDLIAQEVTEAHAQVHFRRKQIENARRGVVVALESFKRNLDRIRGGQGLPIEVLQSIQALAQARREYARRVADFDVAQFALQRAVGAMHCVEPR
jgi:outer membrane protein TolC